MLKSKGKGHPPPPPTPCIAPAAAQRDRVTPYQGGHQHGSAGSHHGHFAYIWAGGSRSVRLSPQHAENLLWTIDMCSSSLLSCAQAAAMAFVLLHQPLLSPPVPWHRPLVGDDLPPLVNLCCALRRLGIGVCPGILWFANWLRAHSSYAAAMHGCLCMTQRCRNRLHHCTHCALPFDMIAGRRGSLQVPKLRPGRRTSIAACTMWGCHLASPTPSKANARKA